MSHTPGPWKASQNGMQVFTAGDPYQHGSMYVADVRGWGHLTGRGGGCAFDEDKAIAIQNANARLIAAAPDLLTCCKELKVALAAAMRVIADLDAMKQLGAEADNREQRFVDELHASGIVDGIGVRADHAIAKAEGR